MIPRHEFPRPDFERKNWQTLNGEWEFLFDYDDAIERESNFFSCPFTHKITVPFCYQSKLSGIQEEKDCTSVWYRRTFVVESGTLTNKALLLKFGAVDYEAKIWLNGKYIGKHEGGHTPFSFNISQMAVEGENQLIVKATDHLDADKPRGKQSWIGEKFACFYTPTTGIWQSVWLEYTSEIYLEHVKITPDADKLTALCEVFVSSHNNIEVEINAHLPIEGEEYSLGTQKIVCRQGYGKAIIAFSDFDHRRDLLFWSPGNPNLISVDITVLCGSNEDTVHTYFGLRSVGTQNGEFTINGQPCYQRLILDQGYWTDSIMTPPSDEAIIEDIRLSMEMGFNGARKHQKIEDPRYYYWADKMGFFVWGELPSAYVFNDTAIANASRELIDFVQRDFNHPCIVTWVPLNESWGVRNIVSNKQQQDYARMLVYTLKALDQTRVVSANDGWEQVSETDICALHDYEFFPNNVDKYNELDHIIKTSTQGRVSFAEGCEYKGQPIMVTEYGGIAFDDGNNDSWGYYGKVANEEEFLARLEPITECLIKHNSISGFCYTQLTDVMQETNGLLTEDRKPKVAVEKLKAVFGKQCF